MRPLCHSPHPPPPPSTSSSSFSLILTNWLPKKALIGALSLGLLASSPPLSISLQQPSFLSPPPPEFCRQEAAPAVAAEVTDKGLVEEAWEIVADSFLDERHQRWSSEFWLQKKEDILSTSIQTRGKAHDIIKRMLASLGDPYTRFLSPSE